MWQRINSIKHNSEFIFSHVQDVQKGGVWMCKLGVDLNYALFKVCQDRKKWKHWTAISKSFTRIMAIKEKVKTSHSPLWALGSKLIPVSWQSARRWLSHKAAGRLLLLSSTRPAVTFPANEITAPWLVPNYTALWQRHTGVTSSPKATTPTQNLNSQPGNRTFIACQ